MTRAVKSGMGTSVLHAAHSQKWNLAVIIINVQFAINLLQGERGESAWAHNESGGITALVWCKNWIGSSLCHTQHRHKLRYFYWQNQTDITDNKDAGLYLHYGFRGLKKLNRWVNSDSYIFVLCIQLITSFSWRFSRFIIMRLVNNNGIKIIWLYFNIKSICFVSRTETF